MILYFSIDFIFFFKKRLKVNENNNGFIWNILMFDMDRKVIFFEGMFFLCCIKIVRFYK